MKLFTVLFLFASLAMIVWGKRLAAARERREVVTAAAIPPEQFEVRVSGWSRAELGTILAKFGELYDVPLPRYTQRDERSYVLEWAGGLPRDTIAFLANYLHYPHDMALDGRRIAAAARVAPGAFAGIPADRSALLYVPSDDENFDRVHLLDSAGQAWLLDFGRMECKPVTEARISEPVRALFS